MQSAPMLGDTQFLLCLALFGIVFVGYLSADAK